MKSTDEESGNSPDNVDKAEELKDPMSGYASADALDAQSSGDQNRSEQVHVEGLRDSMSGYASADEINLKKVDAEGTDKIHTEEMKDSMSGYASADALGSDEK